MSVLKALFSNATMEMASVEKMEQYRDERVGGKGAEWKNPLMRSWNAVKARGQSPLDEGDVEFLVDELGALDNAFTTHFKDATYFMTTTESWTSMWERYVDAVERYAHTVAQRSDLRAERVKTADLMIGVTEDSRIEVGL